MRFLFGIVVRVAAAYAASQFLYSYPSEFLTSALIAPTTVATIAYWISQWLPENTVGRFAQFSLITAQVNSYVFKKRRIFLKFMYNTWTSPSLPFRDISGGAADYWLFLDPFLFCPSYASFKKIRIMGQPCSSVRLSLSYWFCSAIRTDLKQIWRDGSLGHGDPAFSVLCKNIFPLPDYRYH